MNTSKGSLRVSCALLFLLFSVKLARADAIYNFSLPANGEVSSLNLQIRAPTLLAPGGLIIIPLTAPVVTTTFPTPGFSPANSIVGLQITPTATLIGLALGSATAPLLLTPAFPGDFFSFPRAPLSTGAFVSTSGTVTSSLALATPNPTAALTVTDLPEPASALLLAFGLCAAGWLGRSKTQ